MDFEEAEVREIREPSKKQGEQIVRLRKKRRPLWPLLALFAALLLVAIVLLPGGKEQSRVSLPAASRVLLKENLPLSKDEALRALSSAGFVVTSGRPQDRLQIAVSIRREGIILRSIEERKLMLWSDWKK